jgi:carnosine N-methyltransferase
MTSDLILCSPCCLSSLENYDQGFVCQKCHIPYPLLNKELPILVPSPFQLVNQTAISLNKELKKIVKELLQLKKFIQTSPANRINHLKNIEQAYENNISLLSSLIHIPPLNTSPIQEEHSKSNRAYIRYETCLEYLRLDWSGQSESQEEISAIQSRISQLIDKFCEKRQTALFLGAGLGRLAYELSPLFDHTAAVDYSIVMACLHQKILKEDIHFSRIELKNAQKNEEQCQSVHASAQHASARLKPQHLTYTVADAGHLPLGNQTISTIVSAYFTDVLPLSKLWPEVLRVLQPGGVFIHYGPLQYHFRTPQECYSAEDLKIYLQSQQFEVCDEKWDNNKHLGRPGLMRTRHNNWSFAAIRRK